MSGGPTNTRAAIASVAVAVLLLGLKAYAVWRTGSVAMLGSLADTGLDLVASLVTLYSVRIALSPADTQHRFGHGKAEAIAALFQVVLIAVSAFGIGVRAIERLFSGAQTTEAESGIIVSVIAFAATIALITYQKRVIARTGSIAIQADSVHYTSDLLLNGSVIAALVLDHTLHLNGADALFGVAIAAWLLFGAWRASSLAIDQLMDKEWPEERREKFLEIASQHPELQGIHDLRTRTAGGQEFVQFHIWVDPDMTVWQAHRVMDEVETKLKLLFPGVEVFIHTDPAGHVDPEIESMEHSG